MKLRLALYAIISVLLVSSCGLFSSRSPVVIRTQDTPRGGCKLSEIQGVLVADPTWGLALTVTPTGKPFGVVWPHGYSARRDEGRVSLLDATGTVVARERDLVEMAPGNEIDGVLYPCAPITVVH